MSPVSETTVVMARNCSSLLVMDEPPSATFLYPNAYPVSAIVAPWRVIRKRQAEAPPEPNASEPVVCRSHSRCQGPSHAKSQEPQRSFFRDPQGYLFRREADFAGLAQNGQGSCVARTQTGFRNPSRPDGRACRPAQ